MRLDRTFNLQVCVLGEGELGVGLNKLCRQDSMRLKATRSSVHPVHPSQHSDLSEGE